MHKVIFMGVAVLTIAGSGNALADHKSWIICPKEAFESIIESVIEDSGHADLSAALRKRYCYDLTMPHVLPSKHSADDPEWIIPYDGNEWIALEVKNKE